MYRRYGALMILFGAMTSVSQVIAQDEPAAPTCAECHGTGTEHPIDMQALGGSTHSDFACIDCHSEAEEIPHPPKMSAVDCLGCHTEGEDYQIHGAAVVGEDPDLPRCWDCHGTHNILPSSKNQSMTHPRNLPTTCAKCHERMDLTHRRSTLHADHPVVTYRASIHGRGVASGVDLSASCNDCHSSRGTAHRIYSPSHPESTVNHFNVPDTCGNCHQAILQDYWISIHGQLVKQGDVNSPVCTHCHGEHGILAASDPRSPVSPTRLATATCAPCHESAALNERYGIPSGRLKSYVDSYHGLKSKAGDKTVANCASCHGNHLILPAKDPRSGVHPANLVHTCGRCHAGISPELAQEPIHATSAGMTIGWPRFFTIFYQVLITATLSFMLLHHGLAITRTLRNRERLPQVRRMSTNEVLQHALLTISFVVLVITGFSLRFSQAFWAQWIFGWEGGFPLRGRLHRVAAVGLMIWCIWHMGYLMTRRGRQYLKDMWPRWRDVQDVIGTFYTFLGWRKDRPKYPRFSYVEKFEYWALVWGTLLMSFTGIMLWFDNYMVDLVPREFLSVMLIIHYYEAWLAFLAILIWHMYSTIFSPDVYPMNPSWLHGRMPKAMYEHEHPGDTQIEVIPPADKGST